MSLSHLGQTRSARKSDHLLQTPDTFVRTMLPGMKGAIAIVHASPALGAAFTQYTAEFEAGGVLGETIGQRFLYVLDGEIAVGNDSVARGGFAYIPQGMDVQIEAKLQSRAAIIEKVYAHFSETVAPEFFIGRESDIGAFPLAGDSALLVRSLVPDNLAHDFAVNTMSYEPGTSLSMVEVHVMEHGLLMLEGSGIYRLGDSWYPVTSGDFIWMAPYCPQWFGALGKVPAKYLIYKDWNRHPL